MKIEDKLGDIEKLEAELSEIRERHKFELEEKQKDILENYFDVIRRDYVEGGSSDKKYILLRLGSITKKGWIFQEGTINPFNGKVARRIRIETGFIRGTDLSREIGFDNTLISHYENGTRSLEFPPSKEQLKYLFWLKDQGYNPFNL